MIATDRYRTRRFIFTSFVIVLVFSIVSIDRSFHYYSLVDVPNVVTLRVDEQQHHSGQSSISTRVLLGITNVLPAVSKYERRRRHLIRHTYLQYYDKRRLSESLPGTNRNRTICSLQEFHTWYSQQNITQFDARDCQLVYTFVFGLNPKNSKPVIQSTSGQHDVLKLNRSSPGVKDMTIAWLQYASEFVTSFQQHNDGNAINFDFIAKVTSQHLIFPDEFLRSPTMDASSRVVVHSKIECKQFIMLSSDLAKFVFSNDDKDLSHQESDPEGWIEKVSQSHPSGVLQPSVGSWKGVSTEIVETSVYDFLTAWDRYYISRTTYIDPQEVALVHASKARIVSFADTAATSGRLFPRLLLGIFTTNSPIERHRRRVIRNTYLKYYSSSDTQQEHRICSFSDIINKKVQEEKCQVAYSFVVGGNATGPTERVDFDPSKHSITIDPTLQLDGHDHTVEDDVTYLNIRENMIEGKSQTWFKYASIMLEDNYFDYIGKTDTDTVVFADDFLSMEGGLSSFPSFPNNIRVYGGNYLQPSANVPFPALMHGKFYLLSPDLARFIVSPLCNRSALMFPSECVAISNFAHSHPLPIRRWRIPSRFWAHPVKDATKFKQVYNAWLANRTAQ